MKKLVALLFLLASVGLAQVPSFKSFSHDEFGTNNFLITSFWMTNTTSVGVQNRYPVGLYLVCGVAGNPLSVSNNGVSRFIIGPVNTYDFNQIRYTFPTAQGSPATVLGNDGSGILSWVTQSGIGAPSNIVVNIITTNNNQGVTNIIIAIAGTNTVNLITTNNNTGITNLVLSIVGSNAVANYWSTNTADGGISNTFAIPKLIINVGNGGVRYESGATGPNIIAGAMGNAITNVNPATIPRASTISGGFANSISGSGVSGASYSVVAGGTDNHLTGTLGSVMSGGQHNNSGNEGSVLAGGELNTIEVGTTPGIPRWGVIGGGTENIISTNGADVLYTDGLFKAGEAGVISGGENNYISSVGDTIAGGADNFIFGPGGAIGGGDTLTIDGGWSVIAGGLQNTNQGYYSIIGGGTGNRIHNTNNFASSILGGYHNTVAASSAYGAVGGGANNLVSGSASTVSGGQDNSALGDNATIGGGGNNTIGSGLGDTISGGGQNSTLASYATVGGGLNNSASGVFSTVGGGNGNAAIDDGTISGGQNNRMGPSAAFSTIAGGSVNLVSGISSVIGGGNLNTNLGQYASIAGGRWNWIFDGPSIQNIDCFGYLRPHTIGDSCTIGGGSSNSIASAVGSTIAGGSEIHVYASDVTVGGGDGIAVSGTGSTVGGGNHISIGTNSCFAVISGGNEQVITSNSANAVIAGGGNNTVSNSPASTIGGGVQNVIHSGGSVIAGGQNNFALADNSVVSGGNGNAISNTGIQSVIAGGSGNIMTGSASSIGGGLQNSVRGDYSVIPGGIQNVASGFFAFAAGRDANATNNGAFVWADSQASPFYSHASDTASFRDANGFYINANSGNNVLSVSNGDIFPVSRFIVGPTNTYDFNTIRYRFPLAQGAAGTVLSNDGSGNLFWGSAGAGGGGGGPGVTNLFTTNTAGGETNLVLLILTNKVPVGQGKPETLAKWITSNVLGNSLAHERGGTGGNSNFFEVYNDSTNWPTAVISNRFYAFRNPNNPDGDFQCLEITAGLSLNSPMIVRGLQQGGHNAGLIFYGDNSLTRGIFLDNAGQWYPTVDAVTQGGSQNLGEANHSWYSERIGYIRFSLDGSPVSGVANLSRESGGAAINFTTDHRIVFQNSVNTAESMEYDGTGLRFMASNAGLTFHEHVPSGVDFRGAREGHVIFPTNSFCVVSNTTVTANTRIYLTYESHDGSLAMIAEDYTARAIGASFNVISSRANDTNSFNFMLVEGPP